MKNKKRTIVMSCISLAMCIVTLFSFSFSWIKRDWSPVIEQEGITITATSALSLIIDGTSTSKIDLVDALRVGSINLQQVSNATGLSNDFFYLESDGEIENAIIKHVDRSESDDNNFSHEKYGYVEFKFMIAGKSQSGESLRQEIFLKGDTYTMDSNGNVVKEEGSYLRAPELNITDEIAEDALKADIAKGEFQDAGGNTITQAQYDSASDTQKAEWIAKKKTSLEDSYNERYEKLLSAIRISITTEGFGIDGEANNSMYGTIGLIGGEHDAGFTHSGLSPEMTGGTYDIVGQKLYLNGQQNADYVRSYDAGKTEEEKVFHDFDDFVNGNRVTYGETTYACESGKSILTIEPNTTHYITIRIWLEGTDPGCSEDIAGLKFDLHLRFDSRIVDTEQTP